MKEFVRIGNLSVGILDEHNWYVGDIVKNKKTGVERIKVRTYHDDPGQALRRMCVRSSYSPDLASIEQVAAKMEATLQTALDALKAEMV